MPMKQSLWQKCVSCFLLLTFVDGIQSLNPDFWYFRLTIRITDSHLALKTRLPYLKRQCHEIFDLYFFHEWNPSGPLINRLKWFCLIIRFREDIGIRSLKNLTSRSVILRRVENF